MTHSEWSDIYYEKLRGMETTVEELKQLKRNAYQTDCADRTKRRQVTVFGGAALYSASRGN